MTPQQQSAWDTVYTASLCAPGEGMVLTREQALVLLEMMARETHVATATDEQKVAVKWLRGMAEESPGFTAQEAAIARTILAMLDMMRDGVTMPAEPTEEALEAIMAIDGMRRVNSYMVYRALHAHLVRPKTRTEWWITGYAENGILIYTETARTEATRDSFVRSAYATAGCERVTIDVREVLA